MPTPSPLTYSVATDTPNGKVVPDQLDAEVAASGVANFRHVEVDGDVIALHFSADVSDADQTTTDATVAAHEATDLHDEPLKAESNGVSSTTEETPQDKIAVVTPPLRKGFWQLHWYAEIRVTGGLGDLAEVAVGANGNQLGVTSWHRGEWHDFGGSAAANVANDGVTPQVWIRYRRSGSAGDTVEIRRARMYLVHTPLFS